MAFLFFLPQGTVAEKHALKLGYIDKPTTMNPILAGSGITSFLTPKIFRGLIKLSSSWEIKGDIAREWEISNDGKELIFYLNKNIKFHDGKECTAKDVKFTYESIINLTEKEGITSPHWTADIDRLIDNIQIENEYKMNTFWIKIGFME